MCSMVFGQFQPIPSKNYSESGLAEGYQYTQYQTMSSENGSKSFNTSVTRRPILGDSTEVKEVETPNNINIAAEAEVSIQA